MYAYCAHSLVMRDTKNEKQWRKLPMTTAQIALSVIMIVASLFLIVVVLLSMVHSRVWALYPAPQTPSTAPARQAHPTVSLLV